MEINRDNQPKSVWWYRFEQPPQNFMKKTEIKKLDQLASEKVRARGKCERCGKTQNLQCAHIISRTHRNTRWDLENLLCLCSGCHIFFAHKEPLEFAEFVREKLGQVKYDHLRMRGQTIARGQDYEAIRLYLENQ